MLGNYTYLLWFIIPAILFIVLYKLILRLFGVVMIPEDCIGILNKKFVLVGTNRSLPDGKIIALNGEAGYQADTLAPGLYFGYWPWQYEVIMQRFITIGQDSVGVVETRDGNPLSDGRVLGKQIACDAFQDARAFLTKGGERGTQLTIIPPGTYRINTALFTVTEEPLTDIRDNMVGIVTTKEGKQLATGEIAGKEIAGHNMFQDAQTFINHGGYKGRQEQVMLAGRYFINPRFATVQMEEMTSVPIAHAGVVIAYVGEDGSDVTGETFKHGNMVKKGQKGVWVEPLDPGKYPINAYTHKVENVPTANIVLNWATGKNEAHNLDKNLSTITVRSADGFTFNLDVSQIIHIPRSDAPKVIARFGSVANLVTQVLEPTIGNYFRNAAQSADAIDFLRGRSQRQNDAKLKISEALQEYNVVAVDTLIGDIDPPAALMKTLTDRKIAEQEQVTYNTQRMAQDARKQLEQAKAQADTQPSVVKAERDVEIARFNAQSFVENSNGNAKATIISAEGAAKSMVLKAEGDAKAKTLNAEADAGVLLMVGEAEGKKITAVGTAEAEVIRLKTEAVGQGNYAVIEIGRALAAAKIPLVPQIMAGGGEGANGGGGSLVNVLLANLIRDGMVKKDEVAAVKVAEAPKK